MLRQEKDGMFIKDNGESLSLDGFLHMTTACEPLPTLTKETLQEAIDAIEKGRPKHQIDKILLNNLTDQERLLQGIAINDQTEYMYVANVEVKIKITSAVPPGKVLFIDTNGGYQLMDLP